MSWPLYLVVLGWTVLPFLSLSGGGDGVVPKGEPGFRSWLYHLLSVRLCRSHVSLLCSEGRN